MWSLILCLLIELNFFVLPLLCVCLHVCATCWRPEVTLLSIVIVPIRIWSLRAKSQLFSVSTVNFFSQWWLFSSGWSHTGSYCLPSFLFTTASPVCKHACETVWVNLRARVKVDGRPCASTPVALLPEYKKLTLSLILLPHCDTRPLRRPQKDSHVPRHTAGGPHHEAAKTLQRRGAALCTKQPSLPPSHNNKNDNKENPSHCTTAPGWEIKTKSHRGTWKTDISN